MNKEYYEEQFVPETGKIERRKHGLFYEYTPEMKKELEDAAGVLHEAIERFFIDESATGYLPFAKEKVPEVAARLVSEVDEELYGLRGPDPTLAIAFVEAHCASLKRAEETIENYLEHSGERTQDEISDAARDLDEARRDQKQFRQFAETLVSLHPELARLYTRKDLLDWLTWTKGNLQTEARKLKKESAGTSNVQLGEVENRVESLERFLEGRPLAADYDLLLKRLLQVREDAAGRLPDLLIEYAARDDNKEARKEIGDIELLLFQYDQVQRFVEAEKREQRIKGK